MLLVTLVLPACTVGPKYRPPVATSAPVPDVYKESPTQFQEADSWTVAQPSDAMLRGKWWEIFNEPELMLQAALDGLGVGYLLDYEVAPHVDDGRLIRLLTEWTPPFPGFHLYCSSRRQMRPVLAAFLETVRGRT